MNKTYRDLFKEIYEKYGIETSTAWHVDLNQELTEKQYQDRLLTYEKVAEVMNDLEAEK